jgi:MFS family permease
VTSSSTPSTTPLPRAVWLLGWVSFFTDTATEMVYPLLPMFLTRVLGAGAMSLGVIEGVAEAANSALKVISGRVADATGRPKRLVLAGYGISSAVRPFIALATSWSHVLGLRFADRLGKGIRGAPRDAMLAEFAPAGQRGRVYGFHRAMDHAGAVLGPLLASGFLYFYPDQLRTLFALTIIPGILVIAILLAVPDVSRRGTTHAGSLVPDTPAPTRPSPMRSRPFARAMLVIGIFGLGNASDAFLLLRLSDVGISAFWIPLLWSGLHVVKVVASVMGGRLSDRFGRRHLIAAGWTFYAAVYGAFAFVQQVPALIVVFLSYGIYFGLTEGVEKAWVADLSEREQRGTAFGYYNAVIGVSALLASIFFGLVWTVIAPQAAFLTGALLAIAATLLLYFWFSDEEDSRHQ